MFILLVLRSTYIKTGWMAKIMKQFHFDLKFNLYFKKYLFYLLLFSKYLIKLQIFGVCKLFGYDWLLGM